MSLYLESNTPNQPWEILVDSKECRHIYWDTGHGFNIYQSVRCEDLKKIESNELYIAKNVHRFVRIKKIKIEGTASIGIFVANSVDIQKIKTIAVDGSVQSSHFENTLRQTALPIRGHLLNLIGVLLCSFFLVWLIRETRDLISWSLQNKSYFVGLCTVLICAWSIGIVSLLYPGFGNPWDPVAIMYSLNNFDFNSSYVGPFGFIISGFSEVFDSLNSVIVLVSLFNLVNLLFVLKYFVTRSVAPKTSALVIVVLALSPLCSLYSLFLERNIFGCWLNIIFFIFAFDVLHDFRREKLLYLLLIGWLSAAMLETSVVLFPLLMFMVGLKYRRFIKSMQLVAVYIGVLIFVKYLWSVPAIHFDNQTQERTTWLRYVADFQYDCDFPKDYFSQEIKNIAGVGDIRNCQVRNGLYTPAHIERTHMDVAEIRKHVFRAIYEFPLKALTHRTNIFLALVGSETNTIPYWDSSKWFLSERGTALDFNLIRDETVYSKFAFGVLQYIEMFSRFPYRNFYLSLLVLLCGLLLWHTFPVVFCISALYLVKLSIVFLLAPAENVFYIYDLYLLSFMLPLFCVLERTKQLKNRWRSGEGNLSTI